MADAGVQRSGRILLGLHVVWERAVEIVGVGWEWLMAVVLDVLNLNAWEHVCCSYALLLLETHLEELESQPVELVGDESTEQSRRT